MKKSLAVVLCLMMVVALFAGCGGNTTTSSGAAESGSTASGSTASGGSEVKGLGDDGITKIAMIHAAGRGDKSFSDSATEGIERAMAEPEKFGTIELQHYECQGVYDKAETTLIDWSDSGEYDIIIVGSFTLAEYLEPVAVDYPNQKFWSFDSSPNFEELGLENVYAIGYKQNESAYLAGAVAALHSESGIIGAIGGGEMDVIHDFILGYIEGAQYVNPSIKVATAYIGDWTNVARGKDLAIQQMDLGADVLFHVAGGAGEGMIEAVSESDGKAWAIGVDADQALAYEETRPEFSEVLITSALKEVGNSLYRALEMEYEDKLTYGALETLGIPEGASGIAKTEYYEKLVSQEDRDELEEIEAKIASGEIEVGTAFGLSADEWATIRQDVAP